MVVCKITTRTNNHELLNLGTGLLNTSRKPLALLSELSG
jgi:hypothetical protein